VWRVKSLLPYSVEKRQRLEWLFFQNAIQVQLHGGKNPFVLYWEMKLQDGTSAMQLPCNGSIFHTFFAFALCMLRVCVMFITSPFLHGWRPWLERTSIKFDCANQQASMMNPSPISQVKSSEMHYRRKHNTEPRQPAHTQNDGRKCMRSTDSSQSVTSSMYSGMSTAASSATTNCSSDVRHRVPEHGAPSIPSSWNSPPCGLPSSNNPHPRLGLGRVFQSDSDWKVLHKPKKLAKLTGHQSDSNVPDPTTRDSFRRIGSSSAVELQYRQRSPSVNRESAKPQPRRGLVRVFQSDSDWKVLHHVGTTKLAKLQRHQSASNALDPTSTDSSRRSRSSSAFELLHRPRGQSVSCGSAFDAEAIASNNMRLERLTARNSKLSNRRAKHRSKALPAGSNQKLYPSSFVRTSTTTNIIKRFLIGLLQTFYTCISPVVLVLSSIVAACLSSDPPWAAPCPVAERAVQRRPSLEASNTCQWAFEALTVEYEFN